MQSQHLSKSAGLKSVLRIFTVLAFLFWGGLSAASAQQLVSPATAKVKVQLSASEAAKAVANFTPDTYGYYQAKRYASLHYEFLKLMAVDTDVQTAINTAVKRVYNPNQLSLDAPLRPTKVERENAKSQFTTFLTK